MTAEEQAFAEQYHDLVYKFLRAHRLPEAEYYDVVIFGYLEAVQRNFRVAVEPERRNFHALANICMKTAVCREIRFRWENQRKANNMAMSMERPLPDDDSLSFHDIVPDETRNVMMEVENRDLISRALKVATARECEVLAYLYSGFSLAEISQTLGLNIYTTRKASSGLHLKTRPLKDGNPLGQTSSQRYYAAHKAEYAERNKAYRNAHKAELRAYRVRYAAKKAASDGVNIESGPVL